MKTSRDLFTSVVGIDQKTGQRAHYGRKGLRRSSANFKHAKMAIYCCTGGAESLRKIKSFEVTDRIRTLRDLFKRLNLL